MLTGSKVTATQFLEILDFGRMQESEHTHGSVQASRPHPDYYVADHELVLCNCVDTVPRPEDEQGNLGQPTDGKMRIEHFVALPTIENALKHPTTREAVQESINLNKNIIIPVTEFGPMALFGSPRSHLVTLHYNTEKNEANLIDSRPGYVSFFYPTGSMKAMLQEGLRDLQYQGQPIDVDGMKFNTLYQGTQHNDTFCGYWTGQNIFDLAGINISGDEPVEPTTPNQQANKYTSSDETRIVRFLVDKSTPVTANKDDLRDLDDISNSSYVHVGQRLSQTDARVIPMAQADSHNDDEEGFEFVGGLSEKEREQQALTSSDETAEDEILIVENSPVVPVTPEVRVAPSARMASSAADDNDDEIQRDNFNDLYFR